jgi:hypothetical protein
MPNERFSGTPGTGNGERRPFVPESGGGELPARGEVWDPHR